MYNLCVRNSVTVKIKEVSLFILLTLFPAASLSRMLLWFDCGRDGIAFCCWDYSIKRLSNLWVSSKSVNVVTVDHLICIVMELERMGGQGGKGSQNAGFNSMKDVLAGMGSSFAPLSWLSMLLLQSDEKLAHQSEVHCICEVDFCLSKSVSVNV